MVRTLDRNAIYFSPVLNECRGKVSDEGNGSIEGYLAVFNNIDGQGERILRGAFTKSITERVPTGRIPLMTKHMMHGGDVRDVVGAIVDAKEDDYGLWIKGEFSGHQWAQEVRGMVKSGVVWGMSVGYIPVRWQEARTEEGKYIVEHTEMKVVEGTLTVKPANEGAVIIAAKTLQEQIVAAPSVVAGATQLRESLDAFLNRVTGSGPEEGKTDCPSLQLMESEMELARLRLAMIKHQL